MANLFWKTRRTTRALLDTPFKTEEEFETIVFTTSDLLKDIYPLRRQVRGGNKPGIPDIIGVDADGSVCIIEMKNTEVDADILPQVLKYAFWAETNPDSIKSLWLEAEGKPDDLKIDWDELRVRIIIVAPTIHRSTLDLVDRIRYSVDLIEVKRWVDGADQFLLVNKLEAERSATRHRTARGARNYDEAYYKGERNSKSVDEFLVYADEMQKLVEKKGWNLERKFTSWNCVFKAGFFNAFGIGWWGTKSYGFFAKLPKVEAMRLTPKPIEFREASGKAYYEITPGKTRVAQLSDVFERAYEQLAGKGAA